MKLALCGFMGSGKSSVAEQLSQRLGLELIETDQLVLAEGNFPSINSIFETYGEKYFRNLEKRVAAKLSQLRSGVIATGGGFVVDSENSKALKTHSGRTVYLQSSFETVCCRLAGANNRPLFQDKAAAKVLFLQRQTVYQDCSDFAVTTDNKSIITICQEIEKWLQGDESGYQR